MSAESQGPNKREVSDLVVRRALRLFDERIERDWSVDELAKSLGVSRADLGRRFARALAKPPLQVLRELRMDRACRLLAETDDGLAKIASEVGYISEFSFSRAFFRLKKMRPGMFRKLARVSTPTRCAA